MSQEIEVVEKPIERSLIVSASRKAFQQNVIAGWTDQLPHSLDTKAKFNTACWRFSQHGARGRHLISVGEGIVLKREDHGPAEGYIAAYVRHELAHALHTEKDLKKVSAQCKSVGVPFSLLNLLEDARIENESRKMVGEPFNWLEWEDEALSVQDWEELTPFHQITTGIFSVIQSDGALADSMESAEGDEIQADTALYFREACAASDTWGVIDVCQRLIEKYPPPPEDESNKFLSGMSDRLADMQASIEAANADEAEAEKAKMEYEPESVEVEECSNADLIKMMAHSPFVAYKKDSRIHKEMGAGIAAQIEREIRSPSRRISTESPTNRINARALASDSRLDIYRKDKGVTKGKIKVAVIVDASGSMSGEPSVLARSMLTAMNLLQRRGKVEGVAIFSAVSSSGRGCTQTLKFPMRDEDIEAVEGFGNAENLNGTFLMTEKALADCDLIFCITDGMICDAPIDVDRLRRRRLNILALYCNGGGASSEHLLQWFPQALHRQSIKEIEAEIAIRVRSKLKGRGMR